MYYVYIMSNMCAKFQWDTKLVLYDIISLRRWGACPLSRSYNNRNNNNILTRVCRFHDEKLVTETQTQPRISQDRFRRSQLLL